MHKTKIKILNRPKLRRPILIEGLPGIGNIGRVCAGYIISRLKAKKFAELYSPHFLPLVILDKNAISHLLTIDFYYVKGKDQDFIIMTGDSQSVSPQGHYEICGATLDLAKEFGVKDIITIGGFATGKEPKSPNIIAAVNSENAKKKYMKKGINFNKKHDVGTIIGASGILLGMASSRKIDAICLMGETMGFPFLITDPKVAKAVLEVITKITGLKIDLTGLEKTVKEMENIIKKSSEIHRKMLQKIKYAEKPEDIKYIG